MSEELFCRSTQQHPNERVGQKLPTERKIRLLLVHDDWCSARLTLALWRMYARGSFEVFDDVPRDGLESAEVVNNFIFHTKSFLSVEHEAFGFIRRHLRRRLRKNRLSKVAVATSSIFWWKRLLIAEYKVGRTSCSCVSVVGCLHLCSVGVLRCPTCPAVSLPATVDQLARLGITAVMIWTWHVVM